MLNLIDSHVHFWDPGRLRYAWLAEFPLLNQAHRPSQLPLQRPGWRVEGVVFIQADCAAEQGQAEVDWVAGLAADFPPLQAIVAFVALERGEAVRPQLAALRRQPLVKGVRRLIQSEPLGFSTRPDFVAGVQALAQYALSFDLCVRHHQLREVTTLVRQCPAVSFVLDHIGKPDIKAGRLDPWRADLRELAALPNVSCKLSGLVTEADPARWQAAALRPYIEHVLEVFGPERVMFGSDWPVLKLAATYAQWVETLVAATDAMSEADRCKLFSQNARAVYRLPDAG